MHKKKGQLNSRANEWLFLCPKRMRKCYSMRIFYTQQIRTVVTKKLLWPVTTRPIICNEINYWWCNYWNLLNVIEDYKYWKLLLNSQCIPSERRPKIIIIWLKIFSFASILSKELLIYKSQRNKNWDLMRRQYDFTLMTRI